MNSGKGIAAYWESTFRGRLSDSELRIFEAVLANTALEDGCSAIDDIARTGGYPPTAQHIAEAAEVWRKQRALARIEKEKRAALPSGKQYMSFAEFLRDNPDMAERVKALTAETAGTKTNPIRGALAQLLRQGL